MKLQKLIALVVVILCLGLLRDIWIGNLQESVILHPRKYTVLEEILMSDADKFLAIILIGAATLIVIKLRRRKRTKQEALARAEAVLSWTVPDPTNEEDYVRSCLDPRFKDEDEDRTFRTYAAFQRVLEPLNSQNYPLAIKAAEKLIPRFSDFDLLYKWLAAAFRKTDELLQAEVTLIQGLASAKRKCLLLTDLGEVESQKGNIHQAVFYWCQALHCLSSDPVDYNAYLLLSYVAKGCGLADIEDRLLQKVDKIRAGQVRLGSATGGRLTALASDKQDQAMKKALKAIDYKYL